MYLKYWRLDQLDKFLSYNRLFVIFYILIMTFLTLYFFIVGINSYNFVKLSKIEPINLLESVNEDLYAKKFDKNSYDITKFKSELKNFSWIQKQNKLTKDVDISKREFTTLINKMSKDNYDLDRVYFTKTVPSFFVEKLPEDLSEIQDTNKKKRLFISIVLPLIVEANNDIILKRIRLIQLYDKLKESQTLSLSEHNWLINLATEYSIEIKYVHKITIAKNLLEFVDIIPNSIAIAQAAKESGWGTSRFAKEGNALFGQYTYDNSQGLLPSERSKGEVHLVKSFVTLKDSVDSYIKNLNSHQAYNSFREKRLELRKSNQLLDPVILVNELSSYAEFPDYIDVLKIIIKINKLYIFDNIKLVDQHSLV